MVWVVVWGLKPGSGRGFPPSSYLSRSRLTPFPTTGPERS